MRRRSDASSFAASVLQRGTTVISSPSKPSRAQCATATSIGTVGMPQVLCASRIAIGFSPDWYAGTLSADVGPGLKSRLRACGPRSRPPPTGDDGAQCRSPSLSIGGVATEAMEREGPGEGEVPGLPSHQLQILVDLALVRIDRQRLDLPDRHRT